jgi:F5/8 type C domain
VPQTACQGIFGRSIWGAGHALSRLEILWEYPSGANPSAYYLYTVSVSDDRLSFTQVIDKSANNESTADQVVLFPAATSARYVRITVTGLPPPLGPNSPYWASFFELHVFGPAEGPLKIVKSTTVQAPRLPERGIPGV